MPDWVACSRSAARVNEPSSHTAMTARIWRRAIADIRKPYASAQNILFLLHVPYIEDIAVIFRKSLAFGRILMGANFGTVGMDWQQRVNWDRLRTYRTEAAVEMMK